MYNLTTTASVIRMTAGTAGQLASSASWVDDLLAATAPTFFPGGAANTDDTGTSATTIVAAPALSTTVRNVKNIVIANESTTVTTTLLVEHYDGTNTVPLFKGSLLPGESCKMGEDGQWTYYDAAGRPQVGVGAGQFLGLTQLTSGTSFTTGPNTRTIKVRGVSGGAGGGGCTSVASAAAAAGGGAGGGYFEKTFAVSPNTAYAYAIGAAGNGASGLQGGNGTASTFTVGSLTVTGGSTNGGPAAAATTTLTAGIGGAGQAPINGDVNRGGDNGAPGVILIVATAIGISGNGGNSPFGQGGVGKTTGGNGVNATGFGAGGSGALTGASAVRTGGNGTPGVIFVEEYT